VLFKLLSLVAYLVFGLAMDDYTGMFLSVSILLAADFWFTKNVGGRLLVGLRWWTRFKEDGTEEWVYETR